MRGIRHHWPIFSAVLVCIVLLLLTTFIKRPRDTLIEKAAALADGQLLCENGTVWEQYYEPDEYALDTYWGPDSITLGELRQNSEVILVRQTDEAFEAKEIQHEVDIYKSTEMNELEYAQADSIYGVVFADNSGAVWIPCRGARMRWKDERILQPFFAEEKAYDAEGEFVIELPKGELNFNVTGFSEETIPEAAVYTVSVLLEDGWHTLPENKCEVRECFETVKTGEYEYVFENGKTATLPRLEHIHEIYLQGSLSGMEQVGGTYRINVYAEQDGQTVMLAERVLETKILGSTLYID